MKKNIFLSISLLFFYLFVSSQTVGPSGNGTLADIWDLSYQNAFNRKFTVLKNLTLKSVEVSRTAWNNGCGGAGSSKSETIDVYKNGVLFVSKVVNVACGTLKKVDVNFELQVGNYELRIRNIAQGQFKVSSDAGEKSIPGVIVLNDNKIAGLSNTYSGAFFNWDIEVKPCSVIALPDTVRICENEDYTLNFSACNSEIWTGTELFTTIDDSHIKLSPTQSTVYFQESPTILPAGTNLVVNGDFEQGNTGFTSEYTFNTNIGNPGEYMIGKKGDNAYVNINDHTSNSSTGKMLVADGSSEIVNPGSSQRGYHAWCQNISVYPNTDYQVEFWSTAANNNVQFNSMLYFTVDGTRESNYLITPSAGNWALCSGVWNSGLKTSVEMCILNGVTNSNGNNFIVDDISFMATNPVITYTKTDSVVVMVTGQNSIDLGSNTSVCNNGTNPLTLNAGTGWDSYLWSTGETTQKISVNSAGTYTVNVNKISGCNNSGTIIITEINCGCVDTDNDGVCDNVDFDDDNDGILDVDECMTSNFHWSNPPTVNGNTATGIINGVEYTYTSSINIETTPTIYNYAKFPNSFNIPNIKVIKNRIASNNSIVFAQPVLNPILVFSSIGSRIGAVPIKFSNPIDVLFQSGPVTIDSPTQITGQEGYVVIRMNGVFNQISFDYLANENYVNFTFGADFATFCDTDNDGTPDYLDLDSDDDGCPDAVEGDAGFKLSDINNGVLAGNIDDNGVPISAAGGQGKGSSADATVESLVCEACATEKPAINGINGDPFHAFYFDAIQELNETVAGLATGEKYKIKVTGTWSVWSNDPTKNVLDAAYRYKEENGSSDITPVNSLRWLINGNLPNRPIPDGYSPDHTYFFELVSTGNGEVFTFEDNYYGDNGGGMNFEFYKILDTIKVCASNTITPLTDFAVGQDLKWYSSETSNDGTAVVPSIDNSITGLREYWVTQTINNCESDRVQLLYLVNETPFINLGNDTTICTGASLFLDAGNYQNYTWSTTETTQTIDVNTTGNYSVEVTNSKSCTENSSIYVTFNPCVLDFFKTDTLYVCQGDSISIASNGIKNGIWFGEDGFTQIHDSLIKVSPLVSSWYGVGNQGGVTKGVNKIVNGDFENGGTGFTSEYVEDCFASPWMQQGGYCVSTDPHQQNPYWTSCGDHTSGTGKMFITDAATVLGAKIWCQTVTVNPNSDYEFSAWIQSVMAPNPAVLEFQINGVLLGSNLNASSTPCEWETYAAQWNSGVSTSAEICLANKNTNGGGNDFALDDIYFGEVTTVTSDVSDSVFVVVNSKPIVTLGNDTTICIEEEVTFDAGTGYYSYDWSTGELTHKINVNSSGTYKVEITNDNGCTQVDSVELIVNQLPVIVLGNDTTICADSTVTFDAVIGAVWNWSNGDHTQTTTVNTTGEYSVIVADEIGCTGYDTINVVMQVLPVVNLGNDTIICDGESIDLDAENIRFNYSWNTGETTQKITIVTTGIYGVEVTDETGCLGSDSMELIVNPRPSVSLSNDTAVCIGESVMLDAQNPGFNYLWSTGEIIKEITINSTGDYEVEVYDAIGCADTGSINLLVKELPVVELGNDTVICEYQSVVLNAENAGLNYLWNSGATSQTINVDQEGLYSVEVRDSIGCLGVNEIYVTKEVIEDPFLEKNHIICEGTSMILKADFPKLYTIIWELDLNDSLLEVSESGAYSSYVVSEYCRDTFIVNVTKIDTPDAVIIDLRGEDNYCFDIESTTLMISSEDAGDIFDWEDFGRSDEVLIGAAGDFSVTVSNAHCSSDYTYKVEEYCEGKFFIPNAFTPGDGNGLNEVFMPVSNGHVDGYDFRIYNRLGVLIFQTKIQGKGWDGKVSDRLVQEDVYVYRIGYNYKAGTGGIKRKEQVGTVTLLR